MSFKPKDMIEAQERYGEIEFSPEKQLYWPKAGTWVVPYYLPQKISERLKNGVSGKPCNKIFVNKDMVKALDDVFEDILCSGCFVELKTFDGCYNVRYIRGSKDKLSVHSYALALDFNAKDNPLNGRSSWSDSFVRCWTENGFIWGGNFKSRLDCMHFEWIGNPALSVKLVS